METPNITRHIPESLLTEILARLPLKSIARFKSVHKTWKSTFESAHFRRLFLSLHQNSSSSWSLMYRGRELLNFHGCKTWDLPKSLASYNLRLNTDLIKLSSSNGLVLIEGKDYGCFFVGNPILQQWFQVPPPPYNSDASRFGFVTNVDENGVVLGFKVVRLVGQTAESDELSVYLNLRVYSSETGRWTSKSVRSLHYFINICPLMNLNGTLYLSSPVAYDHSDHEGVLIALDFYGESDHCRVIRLPDYNLNHKWNSKRALTTSRGSLMFVKILADEKGDGFLKVWRLNNDDSWQLLWEIRLPFDIISDYAPVAMHPFDGNIVYIWNQQKRHLVSCNLRTQNYKVVGGDESTRHSDNDHHQDCFVNQPICDKYMDEIYGRGNIGMHGVAIQFMLPRWMESMPRPPQVEIMDTASLLSCLVTLDKNRNNKRRFEYGF